MTDRMTSESGRADVDIQRADIALAVDKVRAVLDRLRFGSITLTVHDARVMQIDVTERTRLTG